MDNTTPTKEYYDFFVQRLSEILPELFKLHSRLLEIADPITHEIRSSLNELMKKLNYNNCHILFYFLNSLAALKFINLPLFHNFQERIEIKILVYPLKRLSGI